MSYKEADADDVFSTWGKSNILLKKFLQLDPSGNLYKNFRVALKKADTSALRNLFDGFNKQKVSKIGWWIVAEDGLKASLFNLKQDVVEWYDSPISPAFMSAQRKASGTIEDVGKPMQDVAKTQGSGGGAASGGTVSPSSPNKGGTATTDDIIACLQEVGKPGTSSGISSGAGGGGVVDPTEGVSVPSDEWWKGKKDKGSGFGPTDKPKNIGPTWPGKGSGYESAFGPCFGLDPSKVGGLAGKPDPTNPANWGWSTRHEFRYYNKDGRLLGRLEIAHRFLPELVEVKNGTVIVHGKLESDAYTYGQVSPQYQHSSSSEYSSSSVIGDYINASTCTGGCYEMVESAAPNGTSEIKESTNLADQEPPPISDSENPGPFADEESKCGKSAAQQFLDCIGVGDNGGGYKLCIPPLGESTTYTGLGQPDPDPEKAMAQGNCSIPKDKGVPKIIGMFVIDPAPDDVMQGSWHIKHQQKTQQIEQMQ